MWAGKDKPARKYEEYNREAMDAMGSEQEWATEGAQLTLQKGLQDPTGAPLACTPCVIQSLSLVNPQQSNYSFAISNQFRKAQLLGRIDSAGSVVGIAQTSFGGVDGFIQWTKRGPMPPDAYCAVEYSPEPTAAMSAKLMKGMETSVQYFKTFGKRFGMGTELKYTFPLRKTMSALNFRYKSEDKTTIVTGEVACNKDFKVDVLRKLQPQTAIVAELEHKAEQGGMNFRVGSQVNFVGQGMVRVQVDPEMRVKAMASSPVGRGNALVQFVCSWDPSSKMFKQGIDIKMQGAVPIM